MEITLTGRIKSRVKDFGFIHCEAYKCDYFFHESSFEESSHLSIGDLVSFKLRPNKGRDGSHAIDVKRVKENEKQENGKKNEKKLKYYFESKTDLIMGLRHIKEKLEIQKSKCRSNYEDSEVIIDEIQELLDVISDFSALTFSSYFL